MMNMEVDEDTRPDIEQLRHRAALRVMQGEYPVQFSEIEIRDALKAINQLVEENRIKEAGMHEELRKFAEDMNKSLDSDDFRDAVDICVEASRGERRTDLSIPDFLEKYFDQTIAEEQLPIIGLEEEEKKKKIGVLTPYDKSKGTIDKFSQFIDQRENFQKIQRERLAKELEEIREELEEMKAKAAAEWREKLANLLKGKKGSKSTKSLSSSKKSLRKPSTKSLSTVATVDASTNAWDQWTTSCSGQKRHSTSSVVTTSTAASPPLSTPGECTPSSQVDEKSALSGSSDSSARGSRMTSSRSSEDKSTNPYRRLPEEEDEEEEDEYGNPESGAGIFKLTAEQEAWVDKYLAEENTEDGEIYHPYEPDKNELEMLEDMDRRLREYSEEDPYRPRSAMTHVSACESTWSRSSGSSKNSFIDAHILPGDPQLRNQREERDIQSKMLELDKQIINLQKKEYSDEEVERLLNEAGTYRLSSNFLRDQDKSTKMIEKAKKKIPTLRLPLPDIKEVDKELQEMERQFDDLESNELPKAIMPPREEEIMSVDQCDSLVSTLAVMERKLDERFGQNARELRALEEPNVCEAPGGALHHNEAECVEPAPKKRVLDFNIGVELDIEEVNVNGESKLESEIGSEDIRDREDDWESNVEYEAVDEPAGWSEERLRAAVEMIKLEDVENEGEDALVENVMKSFLGNLDDIDNVDKYVDDGLEE